MRPWTSSDDRRGAPRVALLSHGFWTRRFGADPAVIGRSVNLDGEPHEVVGVLTPEIEIGNMREIDVWTALEPLADSSVRVALGARRRDILGLVLGQGLRLLLVGLACGLLAGAGLARIMASFLVGVTASDPLTFTLVPLALSLVALAAAAVPAYRAARCDPASVLRAE